MKFRTMNPCAASLGGRSGNCAMYWLDLAHLVRVELVHLDEGDDAGRDGGEDERREDDRAEQQAVGEQVARLLAEHRPDDSRGASGRLADRRVARRPASPTRSR